MLLIDGLTPIINLPVPDDDARNALLEEMRMPGPQRLRAASTSGSASWRRFSGGRSITISIAPASASGSSISPAG